MTQASPSDSEPVTGPAPHVQPTPQPAHTQGPAPVPPEPVPGRLALLQQAYLLEQLSREGSVPRSAGYLNKKIGSAARRELCLSADIANRIRRELAERGYLEQTNHGQQLTYRLTEAGEAYLKGLERPTLRGTAKQRAAVDEGTITDEIREAQKAYLLLQLLDSDGQELTRGDANRFKGTPAKSLGLNPA